MIYVALLRARRTVIWAALALAVITIVVAVSFITNHVSMQLDKHPAAVPDSAFAGIALIAALVVASISATSLARETPTLPIVWTKPRSRRRIALEYFAVDVAAIVGVALLALVAALVCAVPIDALRHVVHDRDLALIVVRGGGTIVMWYALGQAATAGLPGRGALVVGLSWPLFIGLIALAHANVPGLQGVALVLNVLNPLAWLATTSRAAHGAAAGSPDSLFAFLPNFAIVAGPWLIAALALYLATVLWSRREA